MADFTEEDDALLDALGIKVEPRKVSANSPREQRIITGFEEIQKFVDEHGQAPQHGEERDIFERLYAVRLDRLSEQDECLALLRGIDRQGLLNSADGAENGADALDDDALLAELGIEIPEDDITRLKHVKPRAEIRAAEEIANRIKCEDFEKFKPLFIQVQKDLDTGLRDTRPFQKMAEIKQGEFFIVSGQKAYVAQVGEEFQTEYERRDSRLRVIYDNGTESDILLRSLQRALNRDEAGRRITDPAAGPLFDSTADDDDTESGTIYVLRSKSENPDIANKRSVLHKIGVTGGDVEGRIGNAKLDPTFLMADVDIVATYNLYNINRTKLENLLHRFFGNARLDLEIKDRFGQPVKPREWFIVPLDVIDETVSKIQDGSILQYRYDPQTVRLVLAEG